jgi:hypothetical protein
MKAGMGQDDPFDGIIAQLERCARFPNPRFHPQHVADLVHWCGQYRQRPWDRASVLVARRSPVMNAYFGHTGIKHYFGRGTKPRQGWAVMARHLAGLTLEALRGADVLAGRKPRKGFGSVDGPIIAFVHGQLQHIIGSRTPRPENILRTLKALRPAQRRRRTSHKKPKNVP